MPSGGGWLANFEYFYGYTDEVFYMISLNSKCEVISSDIISRGTVKSSS